MAGPNTIEILIRARDEATAQLQQAAGSLGGFSSLVGRLATGFGPLGIAVTAFAAGAAAAAAGAHSLADEVERLDNLSKQTGVSVGNLQTMQQLLREAGGSAEDANVAINFLNRAIATNDPLLKKLGITTRDTWQAFNQLVQVLASSKDASARTEVAFQLLGRGSAVLLGKIDQLAQQLPTARDEMEKLGVVMSEKTLAAARELDKQTDELNRQWVGITNGWKANTIPIALAMVAAFKDLRDIIAELSGKHVEITEDKELKLLNEQLADTEERLKRLKSGGGRDLNPIAPFGVDASAGEKVALLTERVKALKHEIENVKLAPAVAAIGASLGALGVHLTEQQLDVIVKPHLSVAKAPDLRAALDSLTHVDLTPAQKELAEMERLLDGNTKRAREVVAALHAVDDQTKRLDIRDKLLKVGIDIDKEQIDDNIAKARALLEKVTGLKATLGVEPDVEALDQALKEYGVKASAAQLHAVVRAAGDDASLNAVLLAYGFKLNAAQLKVVVRAVKQEQEDSTPQPKGIVERATPPKLTITPEVQFDFDKALKAQRQLIAEAPKLRAAFASVAEGWRSAVEDMLTQTAIADASFAALYNGLQAGFSQVAANLLTAGQTLGSAMKTIFHSLVNEVLAELARIAAASVFKFILSFFGGGLPSAALDLASNFTPEIPGRRSVSQSGASETVVVPAPEVNVSVAAPAAPVVAVNVPPPPAISVAAPAVSVVLPSPPAISVSVPPAPAVHVSVPPAPAVSVAAPSVRLSVAAPAVSVAATVVHVAAPAAPVVSVAVPPPPAVRVAAPAVSVAAPAVHVSAPAVNLAAPAVSVKVPSPPAVRIAAPSVSLAVAAPAVSVAVPPPPPVRVAAPQVNVSVPAPAIAVSVPPFPAVRIAVPPPPAVSVAAPAVSVAVPAVNVAPAVAPAIRLAPVVPPPIVRIAIPPPPAVRIPAPAVNLSLVAPAVSVAAAAAPVVNVAAAAAPRISLAVASPAVSVAAPSVPRPAVAINLPAPSLPTLTLPPLNLSGIASAFSVGMAQLRASLAGASRALTPPSFGNLAARLAPAPAFSLASARPVAGFTAGRSDTAELAGLLREQNKMLREQRLFAAAGGGNTYQINALDARSVTLDLLAPSGNLRRANDVLAEIAAVA